MHGIGNVSASHFGGINMNEINRFFMTDQRMVGAANQSRFSVHKGNLNVSGSGS